MLVVWYEVCIYFLDVVLFIKCEGVVNKWMLDFQVIFKDKFYLVFFEMVKGGWVKNLLLLLELEVWWMLYFFDELDWVVDGVDVEEMVEIGEGDEEEGIKFNEEVEVM